MALFGRLRLHDDLRLPLHLLIVLSGKTGRLLVFRKGGPPPAFINVSTIAPKYGVGKGVTW
jgi:hypothetical protein